MARPDPAQSNGGFGNGCYGSVLLDNELWQSLAALNGHDVGWVQGCVLEDGHDGDHGAPAFISDGQPQQWLRWRHTGPARIQQVDPAPPGRHSAEERQAPEVQAAEPIAAASPAANSQASTSQASGSQDEALWAIAAAIDRLAKAIADLRNP
ncbi:hypothetical protein DVS77_15400 [Mycolicibacterium moriokaense]|nr:hypothetical protein DVS77_15400 [Mycolicibacterium moriokaense]